MGRFSSTTQTRASTQDSGSGPLTLVGSTVSRAPGHRPATAPTGSAFHPHLSVSELPAFSGDTCLC